MIVPLKLQNKVKLLRAVFKAPHHNPLFDIDEEDMLNGIVALGTIATHYLK